MPKQLPLILVLILTLNLTSFILYVTIDMHISVMYIFYITEAGGQNEKTEGNNDI
jgi:hypothetical protein